MQKYKKLLVAFDGSESSKNALRQVKKLTDDSHSIIITLTVMPSYEGDLEFIGISDINSVLEGPAKKILAQADEIAAAEGIKIQTMIEHGNIFERIVEVCNSEDCDLIAMGRRGLRRLERMLLGSISAKVIGHAKKDVLVIPRDASLGWKNILLATDGSKHSTAASESAIKFARAYGGKITIISVVDLTEEFHTLAPQLVEQTADNSRKMVNNLKNKIEAANIEAEALVKEGSTYEKIVDLANEKNADIIFMGSHGRTGLNKLLMGSVTEKVIGLANCPVMIVRP